MLTITEHQWPNNWPSEYIYRGYDPLSGLHKFTDGAGNRFELFARRKSPPAGWYIKRGAYCFEFVRSADDPSPILPPGSDA